MSAQRECLHCGALVRPPERYCGLCGADAPEAWRSGDPWMGALLADRYRLKQLLGEGGHGRVYGCEHVRMGNELAVKLLRPDLSRDPRLVERFYVETRSMSGLLEPHTVNVFDFGTDELSGCIYLATELLHGADLDALLAEVGRVSLGRAVGMLGQACASIGKAHAAGILHLGIKPSNLFLSRTRDGEDFIKLLDYGVARLESPDADVALEQERAHRFAMPHYLAPEQVQGARPSAATDVYALGAVLHRMVCGAPPFTGETPIAVLQQHMDAPLADPRERFPELDVHGEVVRILRRALAKEPRERYPDVRTFVADLEAALEVSKADSQGLRSRIPSGDPGASGPNA